PPLARGERGLSAGSAGPTGAAPPAAIVTKGKIPPRAPPQYLRPRLPGKLKGGSAAVAYHLHVAPAQPFGSTQGFNQRLFGGKSGGVGGRRIGSLRAGVALPRCIDAL